MSRSRQKVRSNGAPVGSLELEKIGRDLLELSAAFAAEALQRLGARAVDLDTGDAALWSHAIGHQPHHRAGA